MPLDIPLVPVNSDVKVAAMSALVQSIGDLQKFQSTPAAGATAQSKAQSDAEKKEEEAAKKAAARKVLDEKLPGQGEPAPGAAPVGVTPPSATTPTSSGMSGLQFQEAGGSPGTGASSLGFGSDIPVFQLQ